MSLIRRLPVPFGRFLVALRNAFTGSEQSSQFPYGRILSAKLAKYL